MESPRNPFRDNALVSPRILFSTSPRDKPAFTNGGLHGIVRKFASPPPAPWRILNNATTSPPFSDGGSVCSERISSPRKALLQRVPSDPSFGRKFRGRTSSSQSDAGRGYQNNRPPTPELGKILWRSSDDKSLSVECRKNGVNGLMNNYCRFHSSEKLKYYCESCDDVICLDCTMGIHKKHRYLYLQDVSAKHRSNLMDLLSEGKNKSTQLKKSLDEVQALIEDIEEEQNRMRNNIRNNTEELVEALYKKEEDLLQDLNTAFQVREKSLRNQKESIEDSLAVVNRSCQFTESALENGSLLDLVLVRKCLKNRLEKVEKSKESLTPSRTMIQYKTPVNAYELVTKAAGEVVATKAHPPNTAVQGDGLGRSQAGMETQFTVKTNDCCGLPLSEGGDRITVTVMSPQGDKVLAKVQDNQNGSYSVSYVPKVPGTHEVAVSVHGEPIRETPFNMDVLNPRDYSEISEPTICFGSFGEGKGSLKLPCGVATDRQGRIVVADCHNHRVQIFDCKGEFIKSFGTLGEKSGQFNNPTDVAVDGCGNIIVCDKDNHRVQRFNPAGVFINKFGKYGTGRGEFKRPWSVAVDDGGKLYVVDRKNDRVQVFRDDGTYITTFGFRGSGDGQFDQPYYVTVNQHGKIFVTDCNNHRVQVFDPNGCYLYQFGCQGDTPSSLKYPSGITFDVQGNVAVSDQYNHRIQIFKETGESVAMVTKGLNGYGQKCYPKGLCMSKDGRLVVADSDNHRLIIL